ncbi:helix-turn-helix domain-containing protein [Klebsiella pneumoniae]|nr:helix-turn-helix transcriptional regulator [Klebsiella pneumoniae]
MNKKTESIFTEDLKNLFRQRLQEAMNGESNLSFAQKCGLSDSLIGRYLRGETLPTLLQLKKIADASGLPVGWFAGEDDETDGVHESHISAGMDADELTKWWGIIFDSLNPLEKQLIIKTFQRSGVSTLFADLLATGTAASKEIYEQRIQPGRAQAAGHEVGPRGGRKKAG